MEKQIEQLETANKFLVGITSEQTKKIQSLQEEIDKLKKLGSGGYSILDTLPEEDIEKLRKAAVEEV